MRIQAIHPLLVTEKLAETRAFYRALGFDVVFENDFYLHLRAQGPEALEIGFLQPHHPTQPDPFRAPYGGSGAGITLVVEDATAALAAVEAAGLTPVVALRDEPWGQRHFALLDPSGLAVDVVQPIPVADAAYLAAFQEPPPA